MPHTVTLVELQGAGVAVTAAEAIAIAQKLIHDPAVAAPQPPFGPPSLENVCLGADGSVQCRACAVTPAVAEIAALLRALLPAGTRAPGGVRYVLARALHDVDAPPFDTIWEFSQALARFETGDRDALVRGLVRRAATVSGAIAVMASFERRRTMPSPDVLRRELREADARLYVERMAVLRPVEKPALRETLPPVTHHVSASEHARPQRRHVAVVAASLAAGLALIVVSQVLRVTREPRPPAPVSAPAQVSPAAVASTPAAGAPRLQPAVAAVNRRDGNDGGERRSDSTPSGTAFVAALDVHRRPVFSPAFASNGSAVFFHSGRSADGSTALLTADGSAGDLRVMTIVADGARNYHVQPSPDGNRIAFDSDRDGERGVYVASREGKDVRRISGPGYAAVPTWAPDGARLAYVRAEPRHPDVWNLWIHALDSGELRRVTNYRYGQTWGASWFRDGGRIAYAHEDELVILDLVSGRTRVFRSPIERRLVRTPAVAPDGRHIIFQVFHSGAWLVDVSDGTMRCVLTDPTAEEFAWSPDGRRVAFHSRRDGEWGIWIMSHRDS
jgi:Tol biopolymer transport system component